MGRVRSRIVVLPGQRGSSKGCNRCSFARLPLYPFIKNQEKENSMLLLCLVRERVGQEKQGLRSVGCCCCLLSECCSACLLACLFASLSLLAPPKHCRPAAQHSPSHTLRHACPAAIPKPAAKKHIQVAASGFISLASSLPIPSSLSSETHTFSDHFIIQRHGF